MLCVVFCGCGVLLIVVACYYCVLLLFVGVVGCCYCCAMVFVVLRVLCLLCGFDLFCCLALVVLVVC